MFENHDKTISILSYIPILGWIIALIMNSDKTGDEKTYNAFHLRQGLSLMIVSALYSILNGLFIWIPFLGKLTNIIFMLCFVGIAIMGIMNAINGQKKCLIFFGKPAENILGNAFE